MRVGEAWWREWETRADRCVCLDRAGAVDSDRPDFCEVCGAKITAAEDGKLQRDIDFVEHNGHLIRRVWND